VAAWILEVVRCGSSAIIGPLLAHLKSECPDNGHFWACSDFFFVHVSSSTSPPPWHLGWRPRTPAPPRHLLFLACSLLPPSWHNPLEARRLAAYGIRFPGRPAAAAADTAEALLDFLHREYPLAACHPLLGECTRKGMAYHLMAMDVVITMVNDPDELERDLKPFYNGVVKAVGKRSAVASWVLHEQIEAGHRVGWVPRAGGLM